MSALHTLSGSVRFSETDASTRYHYLAALNWAEECEHDLLRSVGAPVERFPRRALQASFEQSFFSGDRYDVELVAARLGTTSVRYEWRILRSGDVAVTGSHTTVHVDEQGRPVPLPAELRARLEQV